MANFAELCGITIFYVALEELIRLPAHKDRHLLVEEISTILVYPVKLVINMGR